MLLIDDARRSPCSIGVLVVVLGGNRGYHQEGEVSEVSEGFAPGSPIIKNGKEVSIPEPNFLNLHRGTDLRGPWSEAFTPPPHFRVVFSILPPFPLVLLSRCPHKSGRPAPVATGAKLPPEPSLITLAVLFFFKEWPDLISTLLI